RDISIDEEEELFHDFDVLFEDQFMPTWRPLTPPLSDLDEDLYSDEFSNQFYEEYLMEDNELPSTIHELPRPLNKYSHSPIKKQRDNSHSAVLELLNAASPIVSAEHAAAEAQKNVAMLHQSQSSTSIDLGLPPPSPMDSPSVRRTSSSSRKTVRSMYESMPGRTAKGDMRRPTTPPPAEREAKDYEGPEWTILEDYALLQAVLSEQRLTHMTQNERSGIKLNWEYISGFVNRVTNNYRSPRQCSVHYQMAVLPREEGRILTIDPLTKKPRKLSLTPTEISHLRKGRTSTHQQYQNDVESVLSYKLLDKMRAVKRVREKREPPFKRVNPLEIPSTGVPPSNHINKMRQWEIDPFGSFPPLHETLAAREARRSAVMMQEKEARMAHDAKMAEEREKQSIAASISSIIVRPSALPHMTGTLTTPPLITLEVPPPPRMHLPSNMQMNTGGGGGVGQPIGGDRGGPSVPGPPPHQQPIPTNPNPLLPHQQAHPLAEHMPSMGGMTRRVGTPLGGNQGMMGSGQGGGSGGGGGSSSQYVMIGGDRGGGGEGNQQGPQGSQGGGGGGQMGRDGGGQTQQVASRMNLMGREGGGSSGQSSGGPSQPVYRAMSGAPPPKRAAPGGIQRMYMGDGGNPSTQTVHIARGQTVARAEMRPNFNPQRVTQRVMPGGTGSRVYMGGPGSGNASPSHGGQSMGGDGGGQTAPTGRPYGMMQPPIRVGIQPPRMGGPMGGNGGPPKRAHSIVPPKNQPGMLVARAGAGIGHMRGSSQINRFPGGTSGSQPRMNVLVRDGTAQGGTLIRGGNHPSGGGGGGGSMGGPSLQSRSIPSSRPMVNPRGPSHSSSSLHLPSLDSSSSSPSGPPSSSSSLPPSNPPSDSLPPSQGGPLPSITLSNSSSSSSSYPNPSSHHSMS
ncbi:hypothetical protein PRIPAC_95065, partial [Pristionchus pacificus]